ncbi:hypothetical protein Tco_0880208, partial [Tanacetum coccineum]
MIGDVGKGFVDNYLNFQEEENNESFCVEEESMPVYDTDIEDVIEEEEGFVEKWRIWWTLRTGSGMRIKYHGYVQTMVKDLGYVHKDLQLYYKIPKCNLDIGLKPLSYDKDVMEICQYVSQCKVIDVFVIHPISEPELVSNEDIDNEFDPLFSYPDNNTYKDRPSGSNVGKSPSGSNDGKRPSVIEDVDGSDSSAASEDSEDSDDSEFDVGDEDRIEDVEVDMDDFRKHTDENVEWVECNEEEVQVPPPFDYEEVDLEDFGSGTESDDLECERKRALKKLAKAHRPVDGQMYTENFYVGQSLANKQLIKEMVSKLSVAQRRQLWFTRNDKTRMRAECRGLVPVFGNGPGDSGLGVGDGGPVCDKPKVDSRCDKKTKKKDPVGDSIKCPWLLHCSKSKKAETWWVKKFNDSHTCLQSRSIGKCTASFLSKEIEETIKPNPRVPISALKDQLQRKYELGMSDMKIFRAKQMAEERVIGDWVKQYAQLRQYALELKEKNPETTIKIDVERCFDVESETRQFRRIYICLGALKNGFKAGNGKSPACLASMQLLAFGIWQTV